MTGSTPQAEVSGRASDALVRRQLGHVAILDPLRGVAAAAVAWYHLTGSLDLVPHTWIEASGVAGFLGVQIFFVISGFIVPYSMLRGGYRLRDDWWRFLAKRLLRLDPPYLASVALAALLLVVMPTVPWFRPPAPHLGAKWLLLHFAYLNAFVGKGWLNPVYWTLAVEFQYYLAIALIFPLVMGGTIGRRLVAVVGLCALAFIPTAEAFLPWHLAIFALGIVTCDFHTGRMPRALYLTVLVPITLAAWYTVGLIEALAAVATALAIAFVRIRAFPKTFVLLGAISYSLYLLHFLIEGTVVELTRSLAPGYGARVVVLVAAAGLTLAASALLYRTVELPARRWSSRIAYARRAASAETAPLVGSTAA